MPVYNGSELVNRALNSIYSQGLDDDLFQVICVDDCSLTMRTFEVLSNYTYDGVHPSNLLVLRHEENKRQGGARNTALSYADGEWILYIDHDDIFVEDRLVKLYRYVSNSLMCDIVMFDYECNKSTPQGTEMTRNIYANQGFKEEVMSGVEFIKKYPMPWTPWCYAYRRRFLLEHNILFAEYVRFEDVDYVMKCTLLAERITFFPLDVYSHIENEASTSFIGDDKNKIEDLLRLSVRMKEVAANFMMLDYSTAMAAMKHHVFHYHDLLLRYLWRLPYSDIIKLLGSYPPYDQSGDKLVNIASKYSYGYALFAQVLRFVMHVALWIKTLRVK